MSISRQWSDRARSFVMRYGDRVRPLIDIAKRARNRRADRRVADRYPGLVLTSYSAQDIERVGGTSAYGQDVFVLDELAPEGFQGVFLDIGCNAPRISNNSYALEQAGWTGYAFDPQGRFADAWQAERETPFIQAAISAEDGVAQFVEFDVVKGWEHELSGFLSAADPVHLEAMPHRIVEVPTSPIRSLVPDPETVDLALIDVEGAEMLVLDGLQGISPRWFIIENNRVTGGDDAIRDRLIAQGYALVARIGSTDDVFERIEPR